MKIVFLDAATVGPADLDLAPLREVGDLTLRDFTAANEVVPMAQGYDAILTNKVPISGEAMEALPGLRYIGVTATGFNIVDVAAARERGITVTNVPSYSTMSVVQVTIGLLLELTHGIGRHHRWVREGGWSAQPSFVYWDRPLVELHGLTLGIIGYGTIGRAVGKAASALGMNVITLDRGKPTDVPQFPMDELLATSDVVSLHCPQTPATAGMVDRAFLAKMKPSAFLVNTARGGLVKEQELADALSEGIIAGAGLDVLSTEPPRSDNPLLSAKNCVITPHYAWASLAARKRLMAVVASNLAAFAAGQPVNVVG